MGDALAMSGAAVWLNKRYGEFVFPYQPENEASVREIFVAHPEIVLMPLREALQSVMSYSRAIWREDEAEIRIPAYLARTFVHLETEYRKDSFQQAYEERGVPYIERWASSPIKMAASRVEQVRTPSFEYIFVHDDSSRGMKITKLPPTKWISEGCPPMPLEVPMVIRPGNLGEGRRTILAYCDLIEHAAQVHVIDSTFFHLAEQLMPRGELFLHRYARYFEAPKHDYLTKHNWEIVI